MAWKKIGEGLYQDTTTGAVGTLKKNSGGGLFVASETTRTNYQKEKTKKDLKNLKKQQNIALDKSTKLSDKNLDKQVWKKSYKEASEMIREKENKLEAYSNQNEYTGDMSDLKGKHISKEKAIDRVGGKDIKKEYIKVKRYPDDANNKEYTSVLRNPYNSKMYAKELSKSYMAEEEYETKNIPKYIQDIDAGRYGNMSDEQAIKNWIDGGADVIYNDDAEKLLKQWDIPIKNDDAYGTYKSELAKQLLPIYKQDKSTSLSKMSLSELRKTAQEYNIDTTGLSEQKLRAKLIAILGNK